MLGKAEIDPAGIAGVVLNIPCYHRYFIVLWEFLLKKYTTGVLRH